jgi:hypothetical protein
MYLHCCVHRAPTIYTFPLQSATVPRCHPTWQSGCSCCPLQEKWYSPAKVTNQIDISCHQSWEGPKSHKMNAIFVIKVVTTINPLAKVWPWWGRKAVAMSCSPYNWYLKVQRTSAQDLCYRWFGLPCGARANYQCYTQCNNQHCYAFECVQIPMPLDNHDDRDCHHNCDASTHAQDYCQIVAEQVAAINYKLIGTQQELKPNCWWPARR